MLNVRSLVGRHCQLRKPSASEVEPVASSKNGDVAGARNVVASLWDVDDESTARLMKVFYTNLQRGQPIDVALRNAKLHFLRGSNSSRAPFYWAAFVVNGDARAAVNAPPRAKSSTAAIAALSALLAVAALLYWRIVKTRGLETPSSRR